ncbi:methyltransferase family protein [Tumebacillus sp. BK434]|uniref:class I SAM-dependent methyltransferase n=1 Tax=Tumebacillus sp. BK434 TaxID=2512169 RepID=UPI0010509C73|nr:class I SAM-dependent methyltransferase [Tumebacillus sp. BK434]TCP54656.1 methyltransferase family protein [Tumebacillus sp. BK434]
MADATGSVEFWNGHAEEWEAGTERDWEQGPRRAVLEFFCRMVPETGRVLDVGCATGVSTRRLLERGYAAVGVEQSPAMAELARGRGVECCVSECDPLPFADDSFDAVFACTSLEWSANPAGIVREMARVVKPGGIIVAVTLGPYTRPRQSAFRRLYGEAVPHNMLMPWELSRLLEEAGLAIQTQEGWYPPQVPPLAVELLAANWVLQASVAMLYGFAAHKPVTE